MSVLLTVLLFTAVAAAFALADDFFLRKQALKYEKDLNKPVETAVESVVETAEEISDESTGETVAEEAAPAETITQVPNEKRLRIAALIMSVFGIVLAAVSFFRYGNTVEYVLKLLCIIELLVPVALMDRRYHRIPNKTVIAGLVIWVLFFVVEWLAMGEYFGNLLRSSFFGLLMGGGVFTACGIFSKNGIGAGDIKLFSVIGLIMGWQGVFNVIFFAVLIIAVYGVIQIATKKKDKHSEMPIGPFTLASMAIVILLGI